MATIKLSIKILLKLLEEILVFKCEYCAGSLLGGGVGSGGMLPRKFLNVLMPFPAF